jgi:hypothetical protein
MSRVPELEVPETRTPPVVLRQSRRRLGSSSGTPSRCSLWRASSFVTSPRTSGHACSRNDADTEKRERSAPLSSATANGVICTCPPGWLLTSRRRDLLTESEGKVSGRTDDDTCETEPRC